MGDAQRGDDAIYFYAAALGITHRLQVTLGATAQLPATGGALEPGRYLLHVDLFTGNNSRMWVKTGPFGTAMSLIAGPPHFPMSPGTITAIEINVRKGDNDSVAATMSGGAGAAGTLYITKVSRGA